MHRFKDTLSENGNPQIDSRLTLLKDPDQPLDKIKIPKQLMCPVMGDIRKVKESLRDYLSEKLASGLTVEQEIDEIKEWVDSLNLDQLSDFIILVGYFQANKDKAVESLDNVSGIPIWFYKIKINGDFLSLFIPEKDLFETKLKNGVFEPTRTIKRKKKQKKINDLYEFSRRRFLVPMGNHFRRFPFFELIEPIDKTAREKSLVFVVYEPFLLINLKEAYYKIATDIKREIKKEIERIKNRDRNKKIDTKNNYWIFTICKSLNRKTDLMAFFYDVPLRLLMLLIKEYVRDNTKPGNGSEQYNYKPYFRTKTREIPLPDILLECGNLVTRVKSINRKYVNKRSKERTGLTKWEQDFTRYLILFSVEILKELGYIIKKESIPFELKNKISFELNPIKFDKHYVETKLKVLASK